MVKPRVNLKWADINMAELDLAKLVSHFAQSNRAEGKSPKTVAWYTEMLFDFVKFLRSNGVEAILSGLSTTTVRQFVYKEYLAFRASFDKHYAEESERQGKEGAVLSFIASTTNNKTMYKFWEQFVTTKMPKHKEFLLKQFPRLLYQLVPIRNKAAHGEKLEKETAEQVRQIVLGRRGEAGLLERLSKIRTEKSST